MTVSTGLATPLTEATEPVTERISVDDQQTAHGGRPRRTPSPPVPEGMVIRAPQTVALELKVRRVPLGSTQNRRNPGSRPGFRSGGTG